jgi:hypothetical protein
MGEERGTTAKISVEDDQHCATECAHFDCDVVDMGEGYCRLFGMPISDMERCGECVEGEVKE